MDKQEIICGIVAIIVIVAVAIGWIMFSNAQYQKAESQRFENVVFKLADLVWEEARYIYAN